MKLFRFAVAIVLPLTIMSCSMSEPAKTEIQGPRWLAGDHHIHSRYSVRFDQNDPTKYTIGGDAIYPIPMNALMARLYGLSWTVATDHGGPAHSKINFELAYPELQQSRAALPDLVQFYGMELNPPGADHSSLIMPFTPGESEGLRDLESRFDRHELWPVEESRNAPANMLVALAAMDAMKDKPVIIANHPSRSATGVGEYGLDDPAELRAWNDTAPDIAIGMAGAPGHQAATLREPKFARSGYAASPTLGGFDQMTAIVGGFWDSMLGEGRHWWITANSDSHVHHSEGGVDFWPGEFSKTYVFADKNHASILDGLRRGRIFVTTGDLISALDVTAIHAGDVATIGDTLLLSRPDTVRIRIQVRDPMGDNAHAQNPAVNRIDLISGRVTGKLADPTTDTHPSAAVIARFSAADWQQQGEFLSMETEVAVEDSLYLRVRGTNTEQLEPEPDALDEDPWQDLWFYSNPVFVEVTP